jgi:hypothetical protein
LIDPAGRMVWGLLASTQIKLVLRAASRFNPNSRPTALVGYILNQTAKPEHLQPDCAGRKSENAVSYCLIT